MNKLFLYLSIFMIGLIVNSCQNDEIGEKQINIDDASLNKFSYVLSQYRQKIIPIIEKEEGSRSNGGYVEFTEEERIILEQEYKILALNGRELFMALDFTEEELNNIYYKGNTDDIALAAVFYSIFSENKLETRAITGNVYADCALAVAGFDVFTCLEGGGKVMVKKMLKTLAGKLLGPVGMALTIAEYTLCVGGFG